MDVQLPDGTVIQGIPDGTTKAQLTNKLIANGYAKSLGGEQPDPTKDMSFGEKVAAGAGRTLTNMGRGVAQIFGGGPSSADVEDQRKVDAPLHATTAGKIGEFIGGAAPVAATAFIPGVNTYAGALAMGGALGASEPVTSGESRSKNAAIGAGSGIAGQYIGNKLASALTGRLAAKETAGVTAQGQNEVRDATLKAAQDAGYVLPPSAVDATWLGNRLESLGGKAALGQEATARNQGVTNELIRKGLGLPENAAISQSALKGIRKTEGAAYERVGALSQDAADALEQLKQARADATAHFKHYEVSKDPSALTKAKAATEDAKTWEAFLEDAAKQAGKDELLPALKAARQRIAKSWTVEKALNTSTGDVSAQVLGRAIDKGAPITGEIETVARFADAFPQFAREGTRTPTAGVSKSEALAAALLGGAGYAATGNPLGVAAAALPLLSGPARSALLSKAGQKLMATPESYGPGMTAILGAKASPLLKKATPAALAQMLLLSDAKKQEAAQ